MHTLTLILCMVFARSFAMGMNRWLDRDFDSQNPRTLDRAIPSGRLAPNDGLFFSMMSALCFVALCSSLNKAALYCSVPLLVILASYSLMKRISWVTHFYLGVCLGLAPIAVNIAISGQIDMAVILLGIAVAFWTSGFDCLYALQDLDFDQSQGLRSIQQEFGPRITFFIAGTCFLLMALLLATVGYISDRGNFYFLGVGSVSLMLVYELWIIRDARFTGKSTKINTAFFKSNAAVSLLFFFFCLLDVIN